MEKKSVGITGTSTGIGKATAQLFKEKGWEVYEFNRPEYDLTKFESYKKIADALPEKIDAFINNAGVLLLNDFPEETEEQYDREMTTNAKAPFFLSQLIIPKIKDKGHLLNISSISGTYPEKEFISYNMSKAALTMMTMCLSKRYCDRIFINSISPGFVATDLTTDVDPITPQHLIDSIPMKRQAQPQEISDLIWYVLNNTYINGSNIIIDGGLGTKYNGF